MKSRSLLRLVGSLYCFIVVVSSCKLFVCNACRKMFENDWMNG